LIHQRVVKIYTILARILDSSFVTHNLNEAAKLSHRVAVVVDGVLRQVGTVREIKTHPADEAVEAFLQELPHSQ
jgi:glycine betaine/proline transport system ATP-binding protein